MSDSRSVRSDDRTGDQDGSRGAVIEKSIEAHPAQSFGDDPLEVRESDHYTDEYTDGFVDKWDELIDWKKRYESEGSFFVDLLKSHGVESVLDVATGTGFHSVRLIEAGFDTVSVDGSAEMLSKAFENGQSYGGHILRVVHADWRWLTQDVQGQFDAVICLGNSFTHLFSERDRRKALAEFYSVLKPNGILIIDHRNYDSILDNGFSSKHTYYYCGESVSAEPEYVDEGLARFRYRFPDKSQYHLNMYPLRQDYVRRLLREVGFQQVDSYGDFQENFADDEPDFLVHIAEKAYTKEDERASKYSSAVHTARDYYNSEDADNFYYAIWGGEDIHVGLYEPDETDIKEPSRRTVERMASKVTITSKTRVLDAGAGYGGAARYLAKTYGCHVTCLNLSEVENERNRKANEEQGLSHLIEVTDGSFEDMPYQDNSFDVVWSQDSFLHSGDRVRSLQEVDRVLKPGGEFIFTDPMAKDGATKDVLRPILDRLHLESLGSPGRYERELKRLGMREVTFEDHSSQLPAHYGRVLSQLEKREADIAGQVSQAYIDRMKQGLRHWVEGGNSGNLAWGIFVARS
ncbi:glycine/sarcosine N-methyltransferase [Haloechinothrix alba]|uniref:Glycine/sarcosine N-methyltransferase n=1 Tax=Haloechinothrix alba TaxID=664784 RepID=A0A238Z0Y4_9PSEU|nr:class I SAM-dependent methyltransferase [Haloechinothrix alba]SNR76519.1 glycine/sarcosine N-methyltransferase [Haloechinothrix alba]